MRQITREEWDQLQRERANQGNRGESPRQSRIGALSSSWDEPIRRSVGDQPQTANIAGLPQGYSPAEVAGLLADQLQDAEVGAPAEGDRVVSAYAGDRQTGRTLSDGTYYEATPGSRRGQYQAVKEDKLAGQMEEFARQALLAADSPVQPWRIDQLPPVVQQQMALPIDRAVAERAVAYMGTLGLPPQQAIELASSGVPSAALVQAARRSGEVVGTNRAMAALGGVRDPVAGIPTHELEMLLPDVAVARNLPETTADAAALMGLEPIRALGRQETQDYGEADGKGRKVNGRRNPFNKEPGQPMTGQLRVPVLVGRATEPVNRQVDGAWQVVGQQVPTMTVSQQAVPGQAWLRKERAINPAALDVAVINPLAEVPDDLADAMGFYYNAAGDKAVTGGYDADMGVPIPDGIDSIANGLARADDPSARGRQLRKMTLGQAMQQVLNQNTTPLVDLHDDDIVPQVDSRTGKEVLVNRQNGLPVFPLQNQRYGGPVQTYRVGQDSQYTNQVYDDVARVLESAVGPGYQAATNAALRDPEINALQWQALQTMLPEDMLPRGGIDPTRNPFLTVAKALAAGGRLVPGEGPPPQAVSQDPSERAMLWDSSVAPAREAPPFTGAGAVVMLDPQSGRWMNQATADPREAEAVAADLRSRGVQAMALPLAQGAPAETSIELGAQLQRLQQDRLAQAQAAGVKRPYNSPILPPPQPAAAGAGGVQVTPELLSVIPGGPTGDLGRALQNPARQSSYQQATDFLSGWMARNPQLVPAPAPRAVVAASAAMPEESFIDVAPLTEPVAPVPNRYVELVEQPRIPGLPLSANAQALPTPADEEAAALGAYMARRAADQEQAQFVQSARSAMQDLPSGVENPLLQLGQVLAGRRARQGALF